MCCMRAFIVNAEQAGRLAGGGSVVQTGRFFPLLALCFAGSIVYENTYDRNS